MFKVGEFTVKFSRTFEDESGKAISRIAMLSMKKDRIKVRIDRRRTVCTIKSKGKEDYVLYTGIARLHPNDQHDKITGKKVALTYAIEGWMQKSDRTLIWKAFWQWVASWKQEKE